MKGITLQEISDETVQQIHANYIRQPAFAHTQGTASAYKVTLNPAPTSLDDGFGITIVPHVANEANVTLNINGLGAVNLRDQKGIAYKTGKLQVGKPYTFRKVGTDFLADSGGGATGNATAGDIRKGKTATTEAGEITGTLTGYNPSISDITPSPININQPANSTFAIPLVNLGSNNGLLQLINGSITIPLNTDRAVISISSNSNFNTSIYLTNSMNSTINGSLLISATYGATAYLLACTIDYVRRKYSSYSPNQSYNETDINSNLSMTIPSYLLWYGVNSSDESKYVGANIRGQLSTISM